MQLGRNAAESVKESAANVGASAKAGMDKTKATSQEKVEKMRAHDPVEKDMARERKEEKLHQAELNKQHQQAGTGIGTGPGPTTGTGTCTYDPTVGGTNR